MGGKKGGSSTSTQVVQYIPGYKDLLTNYVSQLPGLIGAQQDFSQAMSPAETQLYSILGGLGKTGFNTGADTLIKDALLNAAGLTAKPTLPLTAPSTDLSSNPMAAADYYFNNQSSPELNSMYQAYKTAYDTQKAIEQQKLADNMRSFESDLAAKGRLGSGVHLTGSLNRARESATNMSTYGGKMADNLINQARLLTTYKTGLQNDILSGLANSYGSTGMANLLTTANTLASVPQQIAGAEREANINDLLYRIGLGTRVAGGYGTGMNASSASSSTPGGMDWSKVIAPSIGNIFAGMYSNPNIWKG
jgi:hypothetical protein